MKKVLLFVLSFLSLVVLIGCQNISTSPSGISIELPDKLEYVLNEEFDSKGLVVYSHQHNGDTKTLSADDYEVKNTNFNKLGVFEVEVEFKGKSAYFSVLVKEDSSTIKFAYISNFANTVFYSTKPTLETLNLEGLEITYIHPNFTTSDADISDFKPLIVDLDLADQNYDIYIVNMSHETLTSVVVTFYIYVAK